MENPNNFFVGQKVVALKTNSVTKKGSVYTVLELFGCCIPQVLVNHGLKGHSECAHCSSFTIGKIYLDSKLFAPIVDPSILADWSEVHETIDLPVRQPETV